MSENREIPNGWVWAKLGEVCKLKNGYAFKSSDYSKEGIPVIRISDINEGVVSVDESVKVIANQEYDNYIISKDEILVAMSGATTGKFGIFRNNIIAYQNQRVGKFQILDINALNNTFLLFLLYSLKRKILEDAYGGAQPNISSGKIEELEIPLPPFSEQHRIVAKIEELFSSLDKGIENLKTAQQQLKIYRQAVLKWAFEGKLTNRNVADGVLPEGWKWVKLGEVCTNVEYGSAAKSKEIGKVPVLRMGNIQGGKIDWDDLVYTDDEIEINKYLLRKNDVLFNRTNSPEWVGKTAMYKGERPAIFAGYLIRINHIDALIDPSYLAYYLNSHIAKKYGNSVKSFGVNQANINGTKLKTYPLPLPLLSEQHEIVAEIESRLSVCDKIEESIEHSLKQSEALRQSILKKAFEGKLVPQDPSDEPATVLLGRIWAERALRQVQGKSKPVKKIRNKKEKA